VYVYVDTCTRPRKEEGIEAPGLGNNYEKNVRERLLRSSLC